MKMRFISIIILLVTVSLFNSCYNESRLLVNADFQTTIEEDNYTAPVKVTFENNTTGADFYKWTFEGGNPATSSEKVPAKVTYAKAGTYKIVLEAWNDHERSTKEFTFEVDSTVVVGFQAEVLINDFAPANVQITNKTTGASSFEWTFEGGEPATSNEQYPGNILFREAGEHSISLTVKNGRETFSYSQKINLNLPVSVDFDIEPSFDDFDYEAPFTAALINKTVSGLTYEWTSNGGVIASPTDENTSVTFLNSGTYNIVLKADNEKEAKTLEKQIIIKANSNLYTVKDVKFGVKSAVNTVGSFFSLNTRTIIPQDKVSSENGKDINILFYGINATFEKCYFTSPDMASAAGFYTIPDATKTYFVNTLETSGLTFSGSTFDMMTTDTPLRNIDIKTAANTTSWFVANPVGRIILFETTDGRKGAIKVKAFVSEGTRSYILTDIKYQKEKVQ
ncbi:PKD domain-containing protein [Bacteroides reticulotermitis]|uniref:PKD domain-containing protein n=1 Tax=Bacteroides reticulotermitis TaxID=1133319 RepID=UPI003A84FE18